MATTECIFCDMKNIDAQGILFQDDKCMVILDKFPISKGHLLIIPKKHYENMLETPDWVIDDMFEIAKIAAIMLTKKLEASGVNVTTNIGKTAGQYVMHFHVHVIPRYEKVENPHDVKFDHNHEINNALREELTRLLKIRDKSVPE